MSKSYLLSTSLAILLISRGNIKLERSLGTHSPAVFTIKLLAAANMIFGSDSFKVVPKSVYIPADLLSLFLHLSKKDSSLFSSIVYTKKLQVLSLGISIILIISYAD
jgi:hypothetical protein